MHYTSPPRDHMFKARTVRRHYTSSLRNAGPDHRGLMRDEITRNKKTVLPLCDPELVDLSASRRRTKRSEQQAEIVPDCHFIKDAKSGGKTMSWAQGGGENGQEGYAYYENDGHKGAGRCVSRIDSA